MKLRVYLDVADPVTRRRLAALVKADREIVLVAEAEEADVVVSERVLRAGTSTTIAVSPLPLRVTRSGSTFTAYTSTDGSTWTPLAGSAVRLSVSGSMLAGLAVTSHNTSSLCTVTMDGVLLS